MSLYYEYEVACAGLSAMVALLQGADIPVPEQTGILYHDPVLDCTCDALFVTVGDEFEDLTRHAAVPGAAFDPVAGADCIPAKVVEFEVHLTRHVCVNNPLDPDGCGPNFGDCAAVLPCPDELPPERPDDCTEPAPDKATETLWLLQERALITRYLAPAWSAYMCEGICQTGDCQSDLGCRSLRYVRARRLDSGGCAGTAATFQLRWP